MAAYVIAEVTISDDSWIPEYAERIAPLIEKHGGKVLVRTPDGARLEGNRDMPSVVVMIEFPSRNAAEAWYNDPEYAPLIDLRKSGSTGQLMVVDGL